MNKISIHIYPFLFLLLSFSPLAFSQSELESGIYELLGSNSIQTPNYRGFVSITRTGSTYSLTWKIGENQTQVGVGILDGEILSVGYGDPGQNSFGVVSFKIVGKGHLKGKWSPIGATATGWEELKLLSKTRTKSHLKLPDGPSVGM